MFGLEATSFEVAFILSLMFFKYARMFFTFYPTFVLVS